MDKYSNRIASVFQKAGYVKGDAVALMMPNKPEFVATWLGLGKLGVVTALINTHLRLRLLTHCLTIAKVKGVIYANELASGTFYILIVVVIVKRNLLTSLYLVSHVLSYTKFYNGRWIYTLSKLIYTNRSTLSAIY